MAEELDWDNGVTLPAASMGLLLALAVRYGLGRRNHFLPLALDHLQLLAPYIDDVHRKWIREDLSIYIGAASSVEPPLSEEEVARLTELRDLLITVNRIVMPIPPDSKLVRIAAGGARRIRIQEEVNGELNDPTDPGSG
jgi:hypothetical protein